MSPASRIIWRNVHRLEARLDRRLAKDHPLLLVAPPADDLAAQLARQGFDPHAACLSFAAQERLRAAGLDAGFGLEARAGAWPLVILFQPREKALLGMLLEFCASLLEPDGELWLAGENRAGIKSAGRRLSEHFGRHAKLDSARHCTLFVAVDPGDRRPFSLDDHLARWPLEAAGRELTVCSLPGVFAHGRLDAGTQLLLEALTAPHGAIAPVSPAGRVLDFACGSGAVGLALAAAFPALELTLVDDSALALECAGRTFAENGLQCRLVPSDGLTALLRTEEPPFDWIVSNPPFHAGVRQETRIVRDFLADCPRLLRREGALCLVANAHLPYGRWMSELFEKVQVLSADRGYNVWLATGLA